MKPESGHWTHKKTDELIRLMNNNERLRIGYFLSFIVSFWEMPGQWRRLSRWSDKNFVEFVQSYVLMCLPSWLDCFIRLISLLIDLIGYPWLPLAVLPVSINLIGWLTGRLSSFLMSEIWTLLRKFSATFWCI